MTGHGIGQAEGAPGQAHRRADFPTLLADMGAWVRTGIQSALGQYDRTDLGPGAPARTYRGVRARPGDGVSLAWR